MKTPLSVILITLGLSPLAYGDTVRKITIPTEKVQCEGDRLSLPSFTFNRFARLNHKDLLSRSLKNRRACLVALIDLLDTYGRKMEVELVSKTTSYTTIGEAPFDCDHHGSRGTCHFRNTKETLSINLLGIKVSGTASRKSRYFPSRNPGHPRPMPMIR